MKKIILLLATFFSLTTHAQTFNIVIGQVTYQYNATEVGDMLYKDGSKLDIMGNSFELKDVSQMYVDDSKISAGTVSIAYAGTSATVKMDGRLATFVTPFIQEAHVSLIQSELVDDSVGEITYSLSGNTSDGEFYMEGSYKTTLEFNGLTLTNTTPVYSGAAVCIMNGKRVDVKVITGTTNTLIDSRNSNQKACLYIKGHAQFKQKGTLTITGQSKHGIKTGEFFKLKNANIQIVSAVGDGVNCSEYFLMESGSLTVSKAGDEGIQCDIDGDSSTGELADHEGEDSGNIYILGGTINVNAPNSEGIESKGEMRITDGYITVTSSDDGINSAKDMTIEGGYIYSWATRNDGIDSNGNLYIKGGLIYAIGASTPEVAIDANTEQNKKFYLTGGTLVTIGGLERGSSLSQNCYSASSWSKNTWYAMTYGNQVFAFKTPSSGGNTLVVSAASKPTLTSKVTVSDGTEIFGGVGYLNATLSSSGSSVTLSTYTSSQGGGWPGGGGWPR